MANQTSCQLLLCALLLLQKALQALHDPTLTERELKALHAYPHELGLISLLLDGHRRAVRNIVQPFISSIVQRLSRLVLPRIIRYLVVGLQHD